MRKEEKNNKPIDEESKMVEEFLDLMRDDISRRFHGPVGTTLAQTMCAFLESGHSRRRDVLPK